MKFLQIHTFYGPYLQDFNCRHPELELGSYQLAMKTLLADGFSACHMLAPHLDPIKWESHLLVPNFINGQSAWRREHGIDDSISPSDLLLRQISEFEPEVLYLTDPVTYDSAFIRSLPKRPVLVLGWRAAPVLPTTDWSEFDVIISNHEPTLEMAIQRGARAVEKFHPGFPHFLAEAVKDEVEKSDVTFCGQWSADHSVRNQRWVNLAKATLSQPRDFHLSYYFLAQNPNLLPAAVSMFDQGPRFGVEMHRVLKQGRICLNAMIDMGQGMSANMRLFEIAGTGSFQLMEHHDDISSLFEPSVEIETYRSKEELLEKIFYYLDHPEERIRIARKGQERCFRDYSMKRRIPWFEQIVRDHMKVALNRPKLIAKAPCDHQKEDPHPEESGVNKIDDVEVLATTSKKLNQTVKALLKSEKSLSKAIKRADKSESQLKEIRNSSTWRLVRGIASVEKKVRSFFGSKRNLS